MLLTRSLKWMSGFLGLVLVYVAIGAGGALKAETKLGLPQEAEDAFPDMPTFNIFTGEEIKRDFLRIEYDQPLGKPDLGFMLLVPKTWEEVPLTISAEALKHDDENIISLALLRGDEKEVQVEVAYCRIPGGAELEHWARAYLKGSSLEIVHFQKGNFSGRQVFDTLLNAPGDFKVRLTFSQDGDKIFIVSGSAPAHLYRKYMKIFGLAVVSFRKLKVG